MNFACSCCGRFPIAGIIQNIFSADEITDALAPGGARAAEAAAEAGAKAAGYYFHGGDILPMTGPDDRAECLLTHGGQIQYVGSAAGCPPLPAGVTSIDLKGACLIPGMLDPHMHVVGAAFNALCLDLSPSAIANDQAYTIDVVLSALQQAVDKVDPLIPWVLAVGFDPSQMTDWEDLNVRHFATLQRAETIGIVVQSGSGHLSFVNQNVMTWAEITQASPDPAGGYIGRFPDGSLSGIFVEMPAQALLKKAFSKRIPPVSFIAKLVPEVRTVFQNALSVGLTTLNDAGIGIALGHLVEVEAIRIARIGASSPRLASALYLNEWDPTKLPAAFKNGPDFSDDMFFKQAVKLFADGSNQGVTGFQTVPYTQWALSRTTDYSASHPRGNSDITPAALAALMKQAMSHNWQVMVHANGDQAVANVIAAYQDALQNVPSALRHRIEHCSLAHEADLDAMARLELSPSFLIAHVTQWGDALTNILGAERAQLLDRCQTARSKGLTISVHSDHPVSALGPLQMVQDAVTRITGSGAVLNPAERLSPYDALHAVTAGAAWQCRIEDKLGSLGPGKFADLVVLAQSPLTAPPTGIAAIPVQSVYVAGVPVLKH